MKAFSTTLLVAAISFFIWSLMLLPAIEPPGSGGFALHQLSLIVGVSLLVLQSLLLAFAMIVRRQSGFIGISGAASCALLAIAYLHLSTA